MLYRDKEEIFGKEILTHEELKKFWDDNHENDPCMDFFNSFEEWLDTTVDNGYLSIIIE